MKTSISHPIIDAADKVTIDAVRTSVNRFMVRQAIDPGCDELVRDLDKLQDVIETYELALANYWKFALDRNPNNENKKNILHLICIDCFVMMRTLPIPEKPVDMFVHVLKMLAYAYLGEKWEDMRRYIKEHPKIWNVPQGNDSDWSYVVFAGIYRAILYLTRKESWDDMSEFSGIISSLRENQRVREGRYLDSLDADYRASAAHELASMYHLARTVEIVGQFMMRGESSDVEGEINYHIDKAKKHSQSAGSMELDIMLALLQSTFIKMTRNSI